MTTPDHTPLSEPDFAAMRRVLAEHDEVPHYMLEWLLAEVEWLKAALKVYAAEENWGGYIEAADDAYYTMDFKPNPDQPWLAAREALGIVKTDQTR